MPWSNYEVGSAHPTSWSITEILGIHTSVTVVVRAGLKPALTEIVEIDKSWSYRQSMKSAVSDLGQGLGVD